MGLPIWRDPEEKKAAAAVKVDPTAAARSAIRRRPSVHGARNRSRLVREPTVLPRVRTPEIPPIPPRGGSQYSRRNGRAGVPSISTLLESADRRLPPPPPPPVPQSRNYFSFEAEERALRHSLDSLRDQTARLQRRAQQLMDGAGPGEELDEQSARDLRSIGRRIRTSSDRLEYLSELHAGENAASPSTASTRPNSRGNIAPPRTLLPTPPLDQPHPDGDSLFIPDTTASARPSHPLSRSWQPDSPINGLGDRNRSPTPNDAWEIMRSNIEPDEMLPSADSSFTSAAVSHSFSSATTDTTITEPEQESASESGSGHHLRHYSHDNDDDGDDDEEEGQSDSASSLDPDDDLADCNEEDLISETEQFARDMYLREMTTPEGRARIATHERAREDEGNRFALANEPPNVDIGFRLIEDALDTEEGRTRVLGLSVDTLSNEEQQHATTSAIHRMVRFRDNTATRHRRRVRHHNSPPHTLESPRSPPPPFSYLDPPAETSIQPPHPHPVSPPRNRGVFGDTILDDLAFQGYDEGEDEQDLGAMRRVVERLARRDDVPDEWWMSMGINLTRARAQGEGSARPRRRRRSPDGVRRVDMVNSGRVERAGSRL